MAQTHTDPKVENANNKLVLFILMLGATVFGTGEFAIMGLISSIAQDFNVSIPASGYTITSYALGVVIGSPILAVLCSRFERRNVLFGLLVIYAAANITAAISPYFPLLVAARFLSGVPHGAYFGFAALAAANLVPKEKRAQAIGQVMMGLGLSTVIAVPLMSWFGQLFNWRIVMWMLAVSAIFIVFATKVVMASQPPLETKGALHELKAARNSAMWLTVAIASFGIAGLFAVFSYIEPMLISVTGVPREWVPVYLATTGFGMFLGGLFGGWLADRGVWRAMTVLLMSLAVLLVTLPLVIPSQFGMGVFVFLLGFNTLSLGPVFQTRLMDVAGDAQALASSLNASAFNMGNALGAWLGGLCAVYGMGWKATGPVGALMAGLGLSLLALSFWLHRYKGRTSNSKSYTSDQTKEKEYEEERYV